MRNIHIIPTDKPSRLFKDDFGRLIYSINIDQEQNHFEPQNIYITSDEEIKEGDYYIDYSIKTLVEIHKLKVKFGSKPIDCKKIILTTDTDLISDGVQAINDDFLEWFVHNPSYEWVEVKKGKMKLNDDGEEYGFPDMSLYKIIIPKEKIINCEHCVKIQGQELSPDCCHNYQYKIIIPKEEPKQETLEEAAHEMLVDYGIKSMGQSIGVLKVKKLMVDMAQWQAETMYSEEEVLNILDKFLVSMLKGEKTGLTEKWFEQFKKNRIWKEELENQLLRETESVQHDLDWRGFFDGKYDNPKQ